MLLKEKLLMESWLFLLSPCWSRKCRVLFKIHFQIPIWRCLDILFCPYGPFRESGCLWLLLNVTLISLLVVNKTHSYKAVANQFYFLVHHSFSLPYTIKSFIIHIKSDTQEDICHIQAKNTTWHPKCFTCQQSSKGNLSTLLQKKIAKSEKKFKTKFIGKSAVKNPILFYSSGLYYSYVLQKWTNKAI